MNYIIISDGIIFLEELKKELSLPSIFTNILIIEGRLFLMKKWFVLLLTGLMTVLSALSALAETSIWG